MEEALDDAVLVLTESGRRYDGIPWNQDDPLETWIAIGKRNPWIMHASDPRFDRNSFMKCSLISELREMFLHGNWSLGTAFYYENLCFINQVNGGDEWLTMKDNVCFESISCRWIIENGTPSEFERLMSDLMAATLDECHTLDYEDAAARRKEAEGCRLA